MSFKRRLTLSIVALLLASTAALSLIYLRHLLRMQLDSAVQQAETALAQVVTATIYALYDPTPASTVEESWRQAVSEDYDLREKLLRAHGSFPTVAETAVTDLQGKVLVGSRPTGRWVARPDLHELAEKGFFDQARAVYDPKDYEIWQALKDQQDRPVLVVHVAVSTSILRGRLAPGIREVGIAALGSLLAALVLAILFSRVAFRPLDRLGEAIDRMTRGEYAPALPSEVLRTSEYAVISSKLSLLGQQFRDAREGITSLRGNMEQLMGKLEGAVLLFDADDRLIIASASAETFLGLGRWQMMGQPLEQIFPAGTRLGALVGSAAQLRQSIVNQVVELETGPARVLLSVEVMEDFASHRRMGTLVLLRDAETRRQIQTQVEVSTRLAAISRLTSGVAHRIKNPLNTINLHLELLKNRLAPESSEPPKELAVIAREIARLDHVVNTFLDFTRPVELHLAEVRLDGLVDEVAALSAPQAAQQNVRIQVANGSNDCLIQADRDQLKEAILNLVVNGIQAMPDGGELKLALSRVDAEVELAVADQGVGIAPENRDRIFHLYFTTKQKGSGIGLAMTFRLVQLHNGTIDFSSEPGRGTTFRVRFPVVEAT